MPAGRREPKGGAGSPGWSLGEVAVVLASGFLLSALAAAIASAATRYSSGHGRVVPLGVTVAGLFGLWLGLGGGTVILSRRRASGNLAADVGLRFSGPMDLLGGLAVGLAWQYGAIWLLYEPFVLLDPHLRRSLDAPAAQLADSTHGAAAVALLVLLVGVGAPVVEEVFFRGLLLRSLLGRFGLLVAALVDGLVFGFVHLEVLQLAGLVSFGAVLAIGATKLGRLGPGIVAHAAFNTAALIQVLSGRH